MKTASFPSLRVEPELRQAAEQVLEEGESLSNFVQQAIAEGVQRRLTRRDFIARGLRSRDEARSSDGYVESAAVLGRLEGMLERAKRGAKAQG